jgi:hypothetical protein
VSTGTNADSSAVQTARCKRVRQEWSQAVMHMGGAGDGTVEVLCDARKLFTALLKVTHPAFNSGDQTTWCDKLEFDLSNTSIDIATINYTLVVESAA